MNRLVKLNLFLIGNLSYKPKTIINDVGPTHKSNKKSANSKSSISLLLEYARFPSSNPYAINPHKNQNNGKQIKKITFPPIDVKILFFLISLFLHDTNEIFCY